VSLTSHSTQYYVIVVGCIMGSRRTAIYLKARCIYIYIYIYATRPEKSSLLALTLTLTHTHTHWKRERKREIQGNGLPLGFFPSRLGWHEHHLPLGELLVLRPNAYPCSFMLFLVEADGADPWRPNCSCCSSNATHELIYTVRHLPCRQRRSWRDDADDLGETVAARTARGRRGQGGLTDSL